MKVKTQVKLRFLWIKLLHFSNTDRCPVRTLHSLHYIITASVVNWHSKCQKSEIF